MSTHNICFCPEIRKLSIFLLKKKKKSLIWSYADLPIFDPEADSVAESCGFVSMFPFLSFLLPPFVVPLTTRPLTGEAFVSSFSLFSPNSNENFLPSKLRVT